MPRTCAPEGFYTKQPLHHRLPLKDFYTKCLLRQRSFTPEDLQTKQVLHQTAFTTNNFHVFTPIIAKLRFSPEGTRNLSRRKPFQLLHHNFHPNPFTCNSLFQLQPFLHQRPFTLHSFYSSTCFNRTVSKLLCQGNFGTRMLVYRALFFGEAFYTKGRLHKSVFVLDLQTKHS